MKNCNTAFALAGLLALAPKANADFVYQLDDGSPNTGIAPAGGGTMVNGYQAVSGAETIFTIQARLFALDAGTYDITASVWTDSTGGSRNDASLLTSTQDSFVLDGDGWVEIALDTPAFVGSAGSLFYIGLTIDTDDVLYAFDSDSSGSYFVSGNAVPPADLHNSSFHPAGAAFIRGTTVPVPAPASAALIGLGSISALRRRSR